MAAKRKRIHIVTAVNAANVSKSGATYTIKDVCGAVDDIVMNGMLYPADQLATGVGSLDGKPAPAGHPKNAAGQHISAVNGEALASAWIGSYCRNARHEGGRTLVDVLVNEAQAKASPVGAKLVERLDAAIANTNAEPIHVSTGLFCDVINAAGESRGKKYQRIATNIAYDHLAILLDTQGAGTPDDGVGMFLNSEGQPEEIESARASADPEDRRSVGLKAWLLRLVGNGSTDVSFDAITSGLYALMAEGCWIRDVFDRYCVWTDRDGNLYRQDYSVSSGGSVAFSSDPVAVTRKVEYAPVVNHQEPETMKPQILAVLNAAGIKTEGLSDDQLFTAYQAFLRKPVEDQLAAANTKIAGFEQAAQATEAAEVETLAKKLATNSNGTLTVDDLKKLGLARLKELSSNATAAPVLPRGGAAAQAEDDFKSYDLNSFIEPDKAKA